MSVTRGRSCVPRGAALPRQLQAQPLPPSSKRGSEAGTAAQHRDLPYTRCVTPPASAAPQRGPSTRQPTAPSAHQKLPEENSCILTPRKSPEHCHLPLRPETSRWDPHLPSMFLPGLNEAGKAPWHREGPGHTRDRLRLLMPPHGQPGPDL